MRAAILCQLAIGNAYELEGNPPEKQSLKSGSDCYSLRCFGTSSGSSIFPGGACHYMVYNSAQILPCYLVTYKYPLAYQTCLPHNEKARKANRFCKFHAMYHGTGHGCDGFCSTYNNTCI